MKKLAIIFVNVILTSLIIFLGNTSNVNANELTWNWSYSSSSVVARGTFITDNIPDSAGFFQIKNITGTRNGKSIIGLQPLGTAIPGNPSNTVDNLISPDESQHLTVNGFGYVTDQGEYANPYFADFLTPSIHSEAFTVGSSLSSELPISFSVAAVP